MNQIESNLAGMVPGWVPFKIVSIKKMSIFSNSSHLEWRAGLSDIILKGTHQGTIPARFGLIWFSRFREEDLSSLIYIPFLARLAFWPCELLPSLFVRPSTFHILIFSSETTGPIATKLQEDFYGKFP
jgi:hypothetical protein